ncbi:MAG: hypothetical protein II839_10460 [Kiritimatiellae bacterium]|nr:hypothetical protein [Kiritimatiellia bacterium]
MHPLFQKAHILTAQVIDSALEVQRHFGPGLLESIYVKCLNPRLGDRGIARVILKGADAP